MASTKDVPQNIRKRTKEIITPHRIAVAVLVKNFWDFRESDTFKNEIKDNLKAKYRRDFCILILKLIQSSDLTLDELRCLLSSERYTLHPLIIESFDRDLQEMNSCGTGSLLDVIDKVNRLMNTSENNTLIASKEFICKSSVIGFYLRRLIINFDKLSFSEVTAVLQAFKRYYTPIQKRNIERGMLNVATNNEGGVAQGKDWHADHHLWSRRQAELFIATQAALLTNNEERALSPNELQNRIKELLNSNPELAEAHYLSYLNYLRVKEFCGAIDSLHHSFDRNAFRTDRICDEKSKGYRFAALNLAVLHYHFGHRNEALAALKEAIKIAQEANDNVCLQQALSWLYCLNQQRSEKLIEHSIIKSLVLNLFYNMSLGIQSFVQYAGLTTGNPKQIFETLTKSDIINCQHSHQDLVSNSYAQKSSLWLLYGKTEMSSLWSQLLLHFNTDNLGVGRTYYGEGFCEAFCNIANHLLVQGDYDSAHSVLQLARERFPNEPISHTWMLCENLLLFTHALHHEKWLDAETAAQKIAVINEHESSLRLAELYLYKQDFVEAHRCVSRVLDLVPNEETGGIRSDYQVRAMILLAEIQIASSFPDLVPPNVVTLLNSCFVYAREYHLDYFASLIHLHLAHTQLLMGMPAQALRILDRCLVQIFAHGGKFDMARALLLYVKCLVSNSKQQDENTRRKTILECVKMLEKVNEHFSKVEAFTRAKDVLYLQALLYNEVNLHAERNKCAMEYRLKDEEFPSKNNYLILKYL